MAKRPASAPTRGLFEPAQQAGETVGSILGGMTKVALYTITVIAVARAMGVSI